MECRQEAGWNADKGQDGMQMRGTEKDIHVFLLLAVPFQLPSAVY